MGGGEFRIDDKTRIEYRGGAAQSLDFAFAITIDGTDVGKYAEEVKAEMKILSPEGYTVEAMLAKVGICKLQDESPSWLDIDTSYAEEDVHIETVKDQ